MRRPLSAITVRRESYHRLPRRVISEQIESRPVAPIDAQLSIRVVCPASE
jgi:hypothetical protein